MELLVVEVWAIDSKDKDSEDQAKIRDEELGVLSSEAGVDLGFRSSFGSHAAVTLLKAHDTSDVQVEDDQALKGEEEAANAKAAVGRTDDGHYAEKSRGWTDRRISGWVCLDIFSTMRRRVNTEGRDTRDEI